MNIQEVQDKAAKAGVVFTQDEIAAAHRAAQAAQESARRLQAASRPTTWAARFNQFFPTLLRALHNVGDTAVSTVQTVMNTVGVPIVLLILIIVEQQRVMYGMKLFETHDFLAWFGAWALVILNFGLELLIHDIEHRAGWHEDRRYEFSLALLAARVRYWTGKGEWAGRAKSPALRYRRVLRLVTWTILLLALAGSMQSALSATNGQWLDALTAIFTSSSLLEMVTWVGGLLFACVAVLGAQVLTNYVAQKAVEVFSQLEQGTNTMSETLGKVAEEAYASALQATLVQRKQAASVAPLRVSTSLSQAVPLSQLSQPVSPDTETDTDTEPETDERYLQRGLRRTAYTATMQKALDWLLDDPAREGLTVREAAAQSGIAHATMGRAKKILKP